MASHPTTTRDKQGPRLHISWYDLQDSLWFRPTVMTVLAILLYLLTTWLDKSLLADHDFTVWWMFDGGSEGARGVLSSIASTIMGVATTAFSIMLVVLQLSSSQFSPRILRRFTGDPVNQTVLGVFIATFVYSLLVLRSVRSKAEDFDEFVPTIGVTVALLMAFLCIGALIYFFHHSTRTIQASVIIDKTSEDTIILIDRLGETLDQDSYEVLQTRSPVPADVTLLGEVSANAAGYVQDPNLDDLSAYAGQHDLLVQIHPQVGDYVFPSATLATIWTYPDYDPVPSGDDGEIADLETVADAIRERVETGIERTMEKDILFGIQQLADIALRAMSPGVNDPTTAIDTMNRIGTTLVRLDAVAGREIRISDEEGVLRVVMPMASFEDGARIAFDQMRHYSASDAVVMSYLFTMLESISHNLRDESRRVLLQIGREMMETVNATDLVDVDLDRIRLNARWVLEGQVDPLYTPAHVGRPVRAPERPTSSAT